MLFAYISLQYPQSRATKQPLHHSATPFCFIILLSVLPLALSHSQVLQPFHISHLTLARKGSLSPEFHKFPDPLPIDAHLPPSNSCSFITAWAFHSKLKSLQEFLPKYHLSSAFQSSLALVSWQQTWTSTGFLWTIPTPRTWHKLVP